MHAHLVVTELWKKINTSKQWDRPGEKSDQTAPEEATDQGIHCFLVGRALVNQTEHLLRTTMQDRKCTALEIKFCLRFCIRDSRRFIVYDIFKC